jgi:hypothetical protein
VIVTGERIQMLGRCISSAEGRVRLIACWGEAEAEEKLEAEEKRESEAEAGLRRLGRRVI